MTKYPRYQDYVIKDGKLVGEFEEMYRDFADPWEQSSRELFRSEKAVAVNAVARLAARTGARKVLELGSGLGCFCSWLAQTGLEVCGLDCSPTAVEKACQLAPEVDFVCGDVLDKSIYERVQPDIVVMSEITWYILPQLSELLSYFKKTMAGKHLVHLLVTYPPGQQKYGVDWFTDIDGIKEYFTRHGLEPEEWGECSYADMEGARRTYLIGQW